jgi:hypothetical protein
MRLITTSHHRGHEHGHLAFELLFDDGSDSPFALQTSLEAFDRVPSSDDDGKRRVLSVWVGRDGWPRKVAELPCTYRLAARLPDLRPWADL